MRRILDIEGYKSELDRKYKHIKIRTFCGHNCYLYGKGDNDYILLIPNNVIALNQPYMAQGDLVFTRELQSLRGRVKVIGGASLANANKMFYRCQGITEISLFNFNTSSLKDMSGMFEDCEHLKSLSFKGLGLNWVIRMKSAFSGCWRLESVDIAGINTVNCADMAHLFDGCKSLTNIVGLADLKTWRVVDFSYMFHNCSLLKRLDLSRFNTRIAANMMGMFEGCESLMDLNVSSFITRDTGRMGHMFSGCKSLTKLDISNFETPQATGIDYNFFAGCDSLRDVDMSKLTLSGDLMAVGITVNMMFNQKVIKHIKVKPEYKAIFSKVYEGAKVD